MAGKYPASSVYQMDLIKRAAKMQETFFVGGTMAKPQSLQASKIGKHDKHDEFEKDDKKHGKETDEESNAKQKETKTKRSEESKKRKPDKSKIKRDESKAKAEGNKEKVDECKKVKPEESKITEAAKTKICDQSPVNTERPERMVKSNRKQGKGAESMSKAKTTETSPAGSQSVAADQKTKDSAASTAPTAHPLPAPPPTTSTDPKTGEANQANKCETSVAASGGKGVVETGESSVVQPRPKPTHGTLNGANAQSVFIAGRVSKPEAEVPATGQQSVFAQAPGGPASIFAGAGGPQKQPAIPSAKYVSAQSVFVPGKP